MNDVLSSQIYEQVYLSTEHGGKLRRATAAESCTQLPGPDTLSVAVSTQYGDFEVEIQGPPPITCQQRVVAEFSILDATKRSPLHRCNRTSKECWTVSITQKLANKSRIMPAFPTRILVVDAEEKPRYPKFEKEAMRPGMGRRDSVDLSLSVPETRCASSMSQLLFQQ